MICAGDEFGRTQNGNNNAWCQDNKTSWLDWSLLEDQQGFHRFFQECIALRKKHALFRRKEFFHAVDEKTILPWKKIDTGNCLAVPDSRGTELGTELPWPRFSAPGTRLTERSQVIFLSCSTATRSRPCLLRFLKPQRKGRAWYRIIDTAAVSPDDICPLEDAIPQSTKKRIVVPPFGCVVLQSDY